VDPLVRDAAALALTLALGLGPVGALISVLTLRDRRHARLYALVARQFSPEAVRSDIVIAVRPAWLWGRGAVTVDMGACAPETIWAAITRLRQSLPPDLRVVVEGRVGPQGPTRFTIEALGWGRVASRTQAGATSC